MRIVSLGGKISFVLVAYAVGFFGAFAVAIPGGDLAAAVVAALLSLVAVILAARTFRGPGEGVREKRPWWKMTATAPSGFVWSLVFLLQAVSLFFSRQPRETGFLLAGAVAMLIALSFFASALHLVRKAKN